MFNISSSFVSEHQGERVHIGDGWYVLSEIPALIEGWTKPDQALRYICETRRLVEGLAAALSLTTNAKIWRAIDCNSLKEGLSTCVSQSRGEGFTALGIDSPTAVIDILSYMPHDLQTSAATAICAKALAQRIEEQTKSKSFKSDFHNNNLAYLLRVMPELLPGNQRHLLGHIDPAMMTAYLDLRTSEYYDAHLCACVADSVSRLSDTCQEIKACVKAWQVSKLAITSGAVLSVAEIAKRDTWFFERIDRAENLTALYSQLSAA